MNDARRRMICALQDFAESIEAEGGFDPNFLRTEAENLHTTAQDVRGTLARLLVHKIADGIDGAADAVLRRREEVRS